MTSRSVDQDIPFASYVIYKVKLAYKDGLMSSNEVVYNSSKESKQLFLIKRQTNLICIQLKWIIILMVNTSF